MENEIRTRILEQEKIKIKRFIQNKLGKKRNKLNI